MNGLLLIDRTFQVSPAKLLHYLGIIYNVFAFKCDNTLTMIILYSECI